MIPLLLLACMDYEISSQAEEAGLQETDTLIEEEEVPEENEEQVAPGEASLEGQICDPSGGGWITGATVTLDHGDGIAQDTTDHEGRFVLQEIPVGAWTIEVIKGSFHTTIEVTLAEGQQSLPEPACLEDDVAIAVVQGFYDEVEKFLDQMGLSYDLYRESGGQQVPFLKDLDRMQEYVVLACGMDDKWLDHAGPIAENLEAFAEAGGSIYASDWSFYGVELAFPDAVDFYGNDSFPMEAYGGDMAQVRAEVQDPVLIEVLESTTALVDYDLGGWAVVEGVDQDTDLLLSGPAPLFFEPNALQDAPLAVSFQRGEGLVLFTTFHNEKQATADMKAMLREFILRL